MLPVSRGSSSDPQPLAVLGAGAWGTTIAQLLAKNGLQVSLWARDERLVAAIADTRRNERYLAGAELSPLIGATSELSEAVSDGSYLFVAVPAKALSEVCDAVAGLVPRPAGLISCIKGLTFLPGADGAGAERLRLWRQSERLSAALPDVKVAALSGPNLAGEIAAGKPAATTVASSHDDFARDVQTLLQQATFRVYTSTDIVGVELAGALKNVIAIAAGICDGLSLGDNAKSTIITRGLAEIVRLGTHLGGKERTFYGLAGVGDVVATCMSESSRNHRAGVLLAQGERHDSPSLSALTAEGLPTVTAVNEFTTMHGIELPITTEVYRVAYEGKAPYDAMFDLMTRVGRAE